MQTERETERTKERERERKKEMIDAEINDTQKTFGGLKRPFTPTLLQHHALKKAKNQDQYSYSL